METSGSPSWLIRYFVVVVTAWKRFRKNDVRSIFWSFHENFGNCGTRFLKQFRIVNCTSTLWLHQKNIYFLHLLSTLLLNRTAAIFLKFVELLKLNKQFQCGKDTSSLFKQMFLERSHNNGKLTDRSYNSFYCRYCSWIGRAFIELQECCCWVELLSWVHKMWNFV